VQVPQGATPFDRLVDLMAILRSENGCPWDREQTHQSLTPYLIEEAYEALECIEAGDVEKLRGELGDLLLQIVFHAQLATEVGQFTAQDVAQAIVDKMIRRHPHVFGDKKVETADGVRQQWEQIKQREKSTAGELISLLDGIPKHLPALLAAARMTGRASEVGFRWDDPADALEKVREECDEALEAYRRGDHAATREELGDMLFAVANACRMMDVISEDALRHANRKFVGRFGHIEKAASDRGVSVSDLGVDELERLWEESKQAARSPGPESDPPEPA